LTVLFLLAPCWQIQASCRGKMRPAVYAVSSKIVDGESNPSSEAVQVG
jgi:hypothetical protein